MNALFHLGHPAHFHLFKNVLNRLKSSEHSTTILIKKKDVLESLLKSSEFAYHNILPEGRKDSKFHIAIGLLKQNLRLLMFCLKNRPDIMIGTSVSIAHVGWFLRIPSMVVNEDDLDVVPLFGKLAYPFAKFIVSPDVCDNGKWNHKTIKHNSYHELAYLHPNEFTPQKKVVSKNIDLTRPFVLIRFADLGAHHDFGKRGISDEVALQIIEIIEPYADIYISSERELSKDLEVFRLRIDPADLHHFLYFSQLYIGDSQTMAAEAGILGVPFIRFNDFVDRIGYLKDIEKNYGLGYGIKTQDLAFLLKKIKEMISQPNLKSENLVRRKKMLEEKINLTDFLFQLIVSTNCESD